MLKLVYECALQFETESSLGPETDLEAEAVMSAIGRSFLQQHLREVFSGLFLLPFAATATLRSMLDFLSSAPTFEEQWMAQQLKMGLWLLNPYGRTAWYILISSVLYTWEMIAKFRKPSKQSVNIYYRDTPSMARGPDSRSTSIENQIRFRDIDWYKKPALHTGEPDFWLGVLSHINRKMCPNVIEEFRKFTETYEFSQFSLVPF